MHCGNRKEWVLLLHKGDQTIRTTVQPAFLFHVNDIILLLMPLSAPERVGGSAGWVNL